MGRMGQTGVPDRHDLGWLVGWGSFREALDPQRTASELGLNRGAIIDQPGRMSVWYLLKGVRWPSRLRAQLEQRLKGKQQLVAFWDPVWASAEVTSSLGVGGKGPGVAAGQGWGSQPHGVLTIGMKGLELALGFWSGEFVSEHCSVPSEGRWGTATLADPQPQFLHPLCHSKVLGSLGPWVP